MLEKGEGAWNKWASCLNRQTEIHLETQTHASLGKNLVCFVSVLMKPVWMYFLSVCKPSGCWFESTQGRHWGCCRPSNFPFTGFIVLRLSHLPHMLKVFGSSPTYLMAPPVGSLYELQISPFWDKYGSFIFYFVFYGLVVCLLFGFLLVKNLQDEG